MSEAAETSTTPELLPPTETVFRRVAEASADQWIKGGRVDPAAFLPNKGDTRGLSLSRTKTAREAAETGQRGKRFYAVPLLVRDIHPLQVVGDSATHAIIPGWTFEKRKSDEVREGADHLSKSH